MRRGWLCTGVLLLACFRCVPLEDLASYSSGSEGVSSEQLEPRPPLRDDRPDGTLAGVPDAAPSPPSTATTVEGEPAGVPLDPTPASSAPGEPLPSPAAPRAGDAGDPCAALGGFTISEPGSCYMLGDNVFSWQDARNFCQAWGGDLVEIGSPEENAALADLIDGSVWIGANDLDEEGTFRWARGELIEYAAWGLGQPNNLEGAENCAELRAFDDRWSDVACAGDVARRALCEWSPSSS